MKKMTTIFLLCVGLVASTGTVSADYKAKLSSIKNSIESDPAVGAHEIDVIYRLGDVILKGTVASESGRKRAVEIAKNTKGVKSVTDWLSVTNSGSIASTSTSETTALRNDIDLASEIRAAINSDSKSVGERVNVSVNQGNATLKGDLKNFREVDQAISTALMVSGVQDVSSELTINGRPYNVRTFTR